MFKLFKKKPAEFRKLVPPMGYCFATDEITKGGKRVGYMYRDIVKKIKAVDSGWRFFSGEETDEYANDPKNVSMYEVNTIANYDSDIIPFLGSGYGTAFGRNSKTGKFIKEDLRPPPDE